MLVQEDTNAKRMVVAKTKRVHFEKMDSKATSATDVSTSMDSKATSATDVSTSSSECNLASKEHARQINTSEELREIRFNCIVYITLLIIFGD